MTEKKEENIQIGTHVKQTREAAGLTQEQLAEMLGEGAILAGRPMPKTYAKYEAGE